MKDIYRITSVELIRELAEKLDPLAFENPDEKDRDWRKWIVYTRIDLALEEYRRRESGSDNRNVIQDADIPW